MSIRIGAVQVLQPIGWTATLWAGWETGAVVRRRCALPGALIRRQSGLLRHSKAQDAHGQSIPRHDSDVDDLPAPQPT